MELLPIDDHITAIDHDLYGLPGTGVSYVVRGDDIALIETGTSLTVPQTLAGLDALGIAHEAVNHIICTHVHMDHAGGAGYLAEALPNASVYIHSSVTEYLYDTDKMGKLATSVRRAVGETIWPLHGDLKPIDPARIKPAETLHLDLGQDVILEGLPTPGHSPDHVAYWERRSGGMFIGDATSLNMPRYNLAFPVSAPPAYDLTMHLKTIDMLRQQSIKRFYITHTGADDNVTALLDLTVERLDKLVQLAERFVANEETDSMAIAIEWLQPDPHDEQQTFIAQQLGDLTARGMIRYVKKRQQTA